MLVDISGFTGLEVVMTEKMDGENTTMYRDHVHARSLDSAHHPSRAWVKQIHGQICHDIPEGWRVCGENLYAKHSIGYEALPSYFMVFSIWDDQNRCLSWDETVEWCALLDLETAPVIYRGLWDEKKINQAWKEYRKSGQPDREGYVVRCAGQFDFKDFGKCVAKYVRKDHVQTTEHWMNQEVIPNGLKV